MTSTNNCSMYKQCCFNATPNTYCESYVGESSGHGVQLTTKGKDTFEGGRQTSPLRQYLEGVDKGQLGITDGQRLSNTLCRETCAGKEAKSAFLPFRAVNSDTRGSLLSSGERGSDCSRKPPPPSRVLLCPLPGSQKWANEASDPPSKLSTNG